MAGFTFLKHLFLQFVAFALFLAPVIQGVYMNRRDLFAIKRSTGDAEAGKRIPRYAKPPSVPTAPLDLNENVHHTLDEINQILGAAGGAAGGLVMGLTGISITDCGLAVKEEDLNTITCAQFLDKISQCDSMANIKPLLQQAKQKYKKKPNSKQPCFTKSGRKGQRRH